MERWLAAIGGGVGAGVSRWMPKAGAATHAVASSALSQGIGVATGMQEKFSWAGVAGAAVGAGAAQFASSKLPGAAKFDPKSGALISGPTFANRFGASMASGIANATMRTLIDGTDFGDNILAALPDVIGQTIGESIAGRIGGTSGAAQSAKGERRGGLFSAIGDVLGFDGEFGYDGINGPTGEGRHLSLAGLGGAIGDVVGLDGQFGQQGMAGRSLSFSGLGDAIQDVVAPRAAATGTYGDEASWQDTVQRLTEVQTGIGDATFAEGMPDTARLIPAEGNWEAAERHFAPQPEPDYSNYEDITGEFAEFARLHPEESRLLRLTHDPGASGEAEDASWMLDLLAGGVVGGLKAGLANSGRAAVWDLGWAARGEAVEAAVLGRAGRGGLAWNFPVIDSIQNRTIISVASVDTASTSIRSASRYLYSKVGALSRFTERTWAGVTVNQSMYAARQMVVVVPRGAMTSGYRQLLQGVYQQGLDNGVNVVIRRM